MLARSQVSILADMLIANSMNINKIGDAVQEKIWPSGNEIKGDILFTITVDGAGNYNVVAAFHDWFPIV